MAIFSGLFSPNSTASDVFRLWGTYVRDAFSAIGLVQTADTGQINWATVTTSTQTNTMYGYEIWRFNDGMQGTAPLFLKIEYGCGNNYTLPGFAVTIGKGTDGAGVIPILKTIAPRMQFSIQANASNTALPLIMFYEGGAVGFFAGPGTSSQSWSFFVERSRDSTGASTGAGVAVALQNSGGTSWWCYNYPTPLAYAQWSSSSPVSVPTSISQQPIQNASVAPSATTPASPILIPMYGPGVTPWILQSIIMMPPGDAGVGTMMNVVVNGASRVYRSIPSYEGYGLLRINPMIWAS